MKKIIAVLLVALLLVSCASTEEKGISTITVSGSAEVFMTPDMASFEVSAEALRDSSEEARGETDRIISEAVSVLTEKYGVKSDDIKTNYLSLSPEYSYIDGQRTLIGQRGYQSITVTLSDISKIGSIVEDLSKTNGISISSITLDKKDKSKERDEARRLAVEYALDKANVYASALGKSVSGIVSLSDSSTPRMQNTMLRLEAAALSGASDTAYATSFYSYDLSYTDNISLVVLID